MIQDFDMQLAKTDVIMMASVFLVQHLLDSQVHPMHPKIFNDKWVKLTFAALLGFALHGLITNKISFAINNNMNNTNVGINNSVYDIVKFGTVFVVAEAVSAQLLGRPMDFGTQWQMASGIRIAAYCAFDMVETSLPQIGQFQSTYNTLIKVGAGEVLAYFVMDGTMSNNNLYSTISLLAGFAAYELFVKQVVTSNGVNSMSSLPNMLNSLVPSMSKSA